MCRFFTISCEKRRIFVKKIAFMPDISRLPDEAALKTHEWKRFFDTNKKRLMKMDRQIEQLHHEVSAQIDCLECGNCCRSLGPMINVKDIDALSKKLRIKPADFIENYLRKDEDGDFVFQTMPCPFLGDDNYCCVYENRPKACSEYPHTNRKKFYQIYALTVKNASVCPIAFEVLERLKRL